MGFAIGDIDSDADLDIFVTNIGYHPNTRPPMRGPSGSCEYHQRFIWGTCLHYLLRNDGTKEIEGVGTVGLFKDVAASTVITPSPYMPPDSWRLAKLTHYKMYQLACKLMILALEQLFLTWIMMETKISIGSGQL